MLYTTVGVLFIIVFGFELGYNVLIVGDGIGWNEVEPLHGHPVRFNLSGHIIPVVCTKLLEFWVVVFYSKVEASLKYRFFAITD